MSIVLGLTPAGRTVVIESCTEQRRRPLCARMFNRRRRGRHDPMLLSVHRHRKSYPTPSARCAVKHPVVKLLAG
jgi:hypothetical protein